MAGHHVRRNKYLYASIRQLILRAWQENRSICNDSVFLSLKVLFILENVSLETAAEETAGRWKLYYSVKKFAKFHRIINRFFVHL